MIIAKYIQFTTNHPSLNNVTLFYYVAHDVLLHFTGIVLEFLQYSSSYLLEVFNISIWTYLCEKNAIFGP